MSAQVYRRVPLVETHMLILKKKVLSQAMIQKRHPKLDQSELSSDVEFRILWTKIKATCCQPYKAKSRYVLCKRQLCQPYF
jgi:hypothetical protein